MKAAGYKELAVLSTLLAAAMLGTVARGRELGGYFKHFTIGFDNPAAAFSGGERRVWVSTNRLRLTGQARATDNLRVHAAWEGVLQWQDPAFPRETLSALSLAPPPYRVSDPEHVVVPDEPAPGKESFLLLHNVDRLNATLRLPNADITAGRQAVAWGSALVVNPTDVLAPFSFTTLDQEERFGVDALRVRVPTGALGEIDTGIVLGPDADVDTSAFFLRSRQYVRGTDVSALLMTFRNHLLLGVDASRSVAGATVRVESAYVDAGFLGASPTGANPRDYLRLSLAVDRQLDDETYGFVEYHFSAAGATDPENYSRVLRDAAFQDGGVYLLGRHYLSAGFSRNLTALTTWRCTAVHNVADRSLSLNSEVQSNPWQNVYLTVGFHLGLGSEPETRLDPTGQPVSRPTSEFGAYSDYLYGALSFYF